MPPHRAYAYCRVVRTSGLTREQRPKKTKIGTEVAYVTRDSDTTVKVRRSKVNLFDVQKFLLCLLCFDSVGTNYKLGKIAQWLFFRVVVVCLF